MTLKNIRAVKCLADGIKNQNLIISFAIINTCIFCLFYIVSSKSLGHTKVISSLHLLQIVDVFSFSQVKIKLFPSLSKGT